MSGPVRTRGRSVVLVLALGVAAAVGACSGGGETLLERIGGEAAGRLAGADAAAAEQLTRADLDRIPYAVIAVSVDGGPRSYLVPLADNDGYLNYRDAAGNAIVMYRGAVSGTESLGHDLRAVRHDPLDPIAHPTPLAAWPGRVHREYQYAVRDLERYSIVLDCVFEVARRERIEILEIIHEVVRVDETCTDDQHRVANTYWVEADSGFIWRSEQWLGPQLGSYTVEIVRPYEP